MNINDLALSISNAPQEATWDIHQICYFKSRNLGYSIWHAADFISNRVFNPVIVQAYDRIDRLLLTTIHNLIDKNESRS